MLIGRGIPVGGERVKNPVCVLVSVLVEVLVGVSSHVADGVCVVDPTELGWVGWQRLYGGGEGQDVQFKHLNER